MGLTADTRLNVQLGVLDATRLTVASPMQSFRFGATHIRDFAVVDGVFVKTRGVTVLVPVEGEGEGEGVGEWNVNGPCLMMQDLLCVAVMAEEDNAFTFDVALDFSQWHAAAAVAVRGRAMRST